MSTYNFEVILTHEHTDFDALASMLGASLLHPEALPVLPRQLNRNVRDFLTLYKNHLPFVTDNDVPRGRVKRAILVDARSVNWIKGMDSTVEFYIIDHHSFGVSDISQHQVLTAPVGANTTLLVEKLMERDFHPNPVQATLLALGIHEDTGSLTYPSTTHRDALCLSWLLEPENKVNIEVVGHFLNHPLSTVQRQLLQTLIDESEFLEISGHNIAIAQAQAIGFKEELSALATRLRDFHETDAFFLVIDLGDIIQVVARSMTDEIDVGKIATELGGGGHTRAAAAPMHGRDLTTQEIRDRIVALVEQISRSAFTVRQIMSSGRPQTLPPDISVNGASELMRRYGHEGFPVVARLPDGSEELLGVLTRREADRALSHGLGEEQVSRFMRVGNVTVSPDDSVTSLRRTMIESNWGQIPVVDEQDTLIGIVTRTDLIKLWDESSLPRKHASRTAQRLRSTLPPAQHSLLKLIGEEVECMDYTVYVVGGFVRDLLLNQRHVSLAALDLDIVIEGNAIEFARRMQELYGGRVVPHRRFNTAKWLLSDTEHPVEWDRLFANLDDVPYDDSLPSHLDFVTARTEFYTAPTVLPTVEDSSIKLDLHRRDFTINTLALCLLPDRWGELLDFYGGLSDLDRGIVRVLHSLSFVDDPTRILRAVRYEQRFNFEIEPRTIELLTDAIELLDRVSSARIRHELERILQEDEPEKALRRLDDLGVLRCLHPDLYFDGWVLRKFLSLRRVRHEADASDPIVVEPLERLYWGLLVFRLPPRAQPELTERLGLRGETQRMTRGLSIVRRHIADLNRPDLSPSQAVHILDRIDPIALALTRVACSEYERLLHRLEQYEVDWQFVRAELGGNELSELGIPRGPIFGEILAALRAGSLRWKDRNSPAGS